MVAFTEVPPESMFLLVHALAVACTHGAFIVSRRGWRTRLFCASEGLSAWLLYGGLGAYYIALGVAVACPSCLTHLVWPRIWWTAAIGAALLIGQLVMLLAAHLALGNAWSGSVGTHAGQRLVTWGIYARVRHPIYSGILLWAIGAPLVGHGALFLTIVPAAVGVVLRVPAEEARLARRFGQDWDEYALKARRFF